MVREGNAEVISQLDELFEVEFMGNLGLWVIVKAIRGLDCVNIGNFINLEHYSSCSLFLGLSQSEDTAVISKNRCLIR